MKRVVFTLIVTVGVLAGCATTPPSGVPADPNRELAEMVRLIWPEGSLPRGGNVTWQVGDATNPTTGEPVGAWWAGYCLATWCFHSVTVRPGYVTPYTVAHEGGHIVCYTTRLDNSESCADEIASEILP